MKDIFKNWTKEDLVLKTRSGVYHSAKAETDLTTDYVVVDQTYSAGGYDVQANDEYISIVPFWVHSNISRVCDFKQAVDEDNAPHLAPFYNWGWNSSGKLLMQLRVYKDRTYAIVYKVSLDGRKPLYYVDNDLSVKYNWDGNEDAIVNVITTLQNANAFVHSDNEISSKRKKLTRAMAKIFHNQFIPTYFNDLRNRTLKEAYGYGYGYNAESGGLFCDETRELVQNFLDSKNRKYMFLNATLQKEEEKRGYYCNQTPGEIRGIYALIDWLSLRDHPAKQTISKEDRVKELLKVVTDEWDNPASHKNEAIWSRDGSNITLIFVEGSEVTRYGYGSGSKKIFSYNVDTKTRFYGEWRNGQWTFPIPSLKYIATAMNLGLRDDEDGECVRVETPYGYSHQKTKIYPTTIIKGDLTLKELFAGTNIEWIIDNVEPDYKVFDGDASGYYYRSSQDEVFPIHDLINSDHIGTIALNILISTGIPVLEQLLKSKMFNIYFEALGELSHDSCDSVLYDLDKKRSNNYYGSPYGSMLCYHGKAKNLKKMFNMNPKMLRRVDEELEIHFGLTEREKEHNRTNTWGGNYQDHYYRNHVSLIGLEEVIGAPLTNMDPDTFERCVKLSVDGGQYGRNIWSTFKDVIHQTHLAPKNIVKYIEDYASCAEELRDYLRMRGQLMNIQEVKPDIPDIFSEKRYPLRPAAAKRFIPYLPGTRVHRWGTDVAVSEKDFIEFYSSRYPEARDRGEIVPYHDNGRFSGLLISMTPGENLLFLHDDASYWINFYQDEAKADLFTKAIQRVQPLEWRDEKLGLEIIAPTCIKDVQNEGHTLSHCVASYVDPIIEGRENIMFLRRIDMPSSPFYTVEVVDNGEIRQVHCYRNGDPDDASQVRAYHESGMEVYNKVFPVLEFLQNWAKATKKVDARSIKSHYGALCARR